MIGARKSIGACVGIDIDGTGAAAGAEAIFTTGAGRAISCGRVATSETTATAAAIAPPPTQRKARETPCDAHPDSVVRNPSMTAFVNPVAGVTLTGSRRRTAAASW